MEAATKYAKLLLGCYKRGEVEDGPTYIRAIVGVMMQYPDAIVRAMCDPRGGIATKYEHLPNIYQISSECERRMKPLRDMEARLRREEAEKTEERRVITPEERERRKTFIAGWRGKQGLAAARAGNIKLYELDPRKLNGEIRELALKAHEEHLADLAASAKEATLTLSSRERPFPYPEKYVERRYAVDDTLLD